MTAEQAREALPHVRCQFGPRVFECRTIGRQNQFATVYAIPQDSQHLEAHFTWEAIARAASWGITLRA